MLHRNKQDVGRSFVTTARAPNACLEQSTFPLEVLQACGYCLALIGLGLENVSWTC